MITKIVTHDGIFHADEVFAIALIKTVVSRHIPVVRSREISEEDFANENVWIIDVGRRHQPELNNLDHHQDAELEAACVLVLNHLYIKNFFNTEMWEELKEGFKAISYIDRKGFDGQVGFQVNSLIKSLNNLDNGFYTALSIAEDYILSAQASANMSVESYKLWAYGEIVGNVRVCEKYPIHWKKYSGQPFLVAPDMSGKKWCVHSRDSSLYPIISTGVEEFIHAGKFIATFADKFSAVACAVHSDNVPVRY